MVKSVAELAHAAIEFLLARVRKGRMTDVVGKRERLCEVLVQRQRNGNGSGDLRDFDGVSEAVAEVIGEALAKDLSLAFQTAERAGVNDSVAIALELSPVGMGWLGIAPAPQILIRKP
jgi:hypothetical protein